MTTETYQQTVIIPNPLGFHARPATKLSKLAKKLDAPVFMETTNGQRANTKKMFELLSLALGQGAEVTIVSESEEAVKTVVEAIESGLGDDLTSPEEKTDSDEKISDILWNPTGDIVCHQGVAASDGFKGFLLLMVWLSVKLCTTDNSILSYQIPLAQLPKKLMRFVKHYKLPKRISKQ